MQLIDVLQICWIRACGVRMLLYKCVSLRFAHGPQDWSWANMPKSGALRTAVEIISIRKMEVGLKAGTPTQADLRKLAALAAEDERYLDLFMQMEAAVKIAEARQEALERARRMLGFALAQAIILAIIVASILGSTH